MAGHKFTEEQKSKFRFEAWVRNNEETLTILMNDPKKWEFCEDFILPQNGQIPLFDLGILMKMAFQDQDKEKAPEPNPTNSDSPEA